MSDVWYYAYEGAAKGPMGLDALRDALAVMERPGDTLVWRAGFHAWTKATDVSEVADRLFTPPPPTPPPMPQRSPKVVSRSPNIEPGLNAASPPIGGWLIVLAIWQTLAPLRFLLSVGRYYSNLDWKIVESVPAAFVGEALLNIASFTLIMASVILFYRRSRFFPRVFVWVVLATIFYLPINALWIAATMMSAVSGANFQDLFSHAFDSPKEIGQVIAAAIVGIIWCVYLYRSKRAAQTFNR